jgi:hypothetical protein
MMNTIKPIDMAPRANDMQTVRRCGARVAWLHNANPDIIRFLPYIALYKAGFRTLDQLPPSISKVITSLSL